MRSLPRTGLVLGKMYWSAVVVNIICIALALVKIHTQESLITGNRQCPNPLAYEELDWLSASQWTVWYVIGRLAFAYMSTICAGMPLQANSMARTVVVVILVVPPF
jgi:hypothetical protein